MNASDRGCPGEQTPKQAADRDALADWVNEGGSFHRPPDDRDESEDSVGDESSAERKTSYVELRSGFLTLGNIGELLALQAAGCRPGASVSGTGDGTSR